MQNYYFMNKDKKILEFQITETALGANISVIKTFDDHFPPGFVDIGTWLDKRNYAKHKEHFKKWLKEWGIDTISGFINITHCLGINDCLWVKNIESGLNWDNINLYQNQFTDIAQKTAFDAGLFGLQLSETNLISPEFTSEGTAPKCWKKEDHNIYLYKAALSGAKNLGLEANSEYIASNIVRQMIHNDSIPYDLVMFHDKLCSKCGLFTSETYGYIPFYKYIDANFHYTLADVLKICSNMGFEEECRKMILMDSIIFNQDRHLGNFGFLVNNETFEIVKFAPLFDYNSSMLCNALEEDIASLTAFHKYEEEYQLGHKLGGRFSEVGKDIITPDLIQFIPKEIIFPKHQKYNLENDRIQKIMDIFDENLQTIIQKKYYRINYYLKENITTEELIMNTPSIITTNIKKELDFDDKIENTDFDDYDD